MYNVYVTYNFVYTLADRGQPGGWNRKILLKENICISSHLKIFHARMAELVDALVSNTSELTLVPVRSRLRVQVTKEVVRQTNNLFLFLSILFQNCLQVFDIISGSWKFN
jgi:hypothetical protein